MAYKINKRRYVQNSPRIKTIIHWCDLPDNKVIILKPEFQRRLLTFFHTSLEYGQKKKVARKLGLTTSQLRALSRLQSNFSVGSLKRIGTMARVPLRTIERNIVGFGRKRVINNPRFPFDMGSKDGVALRSIMNSEGHISEQVGRSVMIRVPEVDMLEKAINISKRLFGEFDIAIKKTKDNDVTYEIFLPGEIGDILLLSGLTRGRKSVKNPYVPRDIMTGSLQKKRTYLQWSIVSEMECTRNSKVLKLTRHVNISKRISHSFIKTLKDGATFKKDIPDNILRNLSRFPPNLLVGESLLLKDFNIVRDCYIGGLWKYKNGDVGAFWRIAITKREETERLFNQIGIVLPEKREKVKKLLLSYVRHPMQIS